MWYSTCSVIFPQIYSSMDLNPDIFIEKTEEYGGDTIKYPQNNDSMRKYKIHYVH